MRVRCPNEGCSFDVLDDMAGARIRCPHCKHLFFVERDETANTQVQANARPAPVNERQDGTVKLENQLYDGLPPLSVMMALRRQQANLDEVPVQLEMTADDWKALSAFEQVLHAEWSLRTSLIYGVLASVVNVVLAALSFVQERSAWEPQVGRLAIMLLVPPIVLLIPGMIHLLAGRQRLGRLRVDGLVRWLPFTAFCSACVFVAYMAAYAILINRGEHAFVAVIGIGVNLIAGMDAIRAWLHVARGLDGVEPPEILHRLTEALKYLGG